MDHTGYCDLIRSLEQAQTMGQNGDVFLPTWDDCRDWLATRGWQHPELVDGDDDEVHMLLTHCSGRHMRLTGHSDLDCLYRAILTILLAERDVSNRSRSSKPWG